MTGYVKHIDATVLFDGQQIGVRLKPLSYADLLRLRKDEETEVLCEYARMMPQYIESMSPILDSVGDLVTVETIQEAAYFAPLVAQILTKHVGAATVPVLPTSGDRLDG